MPAGETVGYALWEPTTVLVPPLELHRCLLSCSVQMGATLDGGIAISCTQIADQMSASAAGKLARQRPYRVPHEGVAHEDPMIRA